MNRIPLLAAALLLARAASAAPPQGRAPPPEAFDACQGKTTAESCAAPFRDSNVEGTCQPADDDRLFCRPARPPAPPRPPQQAFDACGGKAADDGCSVALPDRTVEGTCAASREGALFCRPPGPPPGGPRAESPAAG